MSTHTQKRGGRGEGCSAENQDRCGNQSESEPKTVAERKRDQRARDEELAQLGLQRLKIYVPQDEIGDYLRSRGITVHEDDPEPLARGVEKLIKKLLDESRDRNEFR
jgi:hypothetical protein